MQSKSLFIRNTSNTIQSPLESPEVIRGDLRPAVGPYMKRYSAIKARDSSDISSKTLPLRMDTFQQNRLPTPQNQAQDQPYLLSRFYTYCSLNRPAFQRNPAQLLTICCAVANELRAIKPLLEPNVSPQSDETTAAVALTKPV